MVSPDNKVSALQSAIEIAKAFAGNGAQNAIAADEVLEKCYRKIIELIDDAHQMDL